MFRVEEPDLQPRSLLCLLSIRVSPLLFRGHNKMTLVPSDCFPAGLFNRHWSIMQNISIFLIIFFFLLSRTG